MPEYFMDRDSLLAEETSEVLYSYMHFARETWDSELSRPTRRVKIPGLGTAQLWLQSVTKKFALKHCITVEINIKF